MITNRREGRGERGGIKKKRIRTENIIYGKILETET
jgi:hypothetical protein